MNESKALRPWDWALLGAALIACGLFFLTRQDPFACFPGVGIPVTYLGLSFFFLLYLRAQKRLCLSLESVFLSALTLLLSACYGLYARPGLECLSLPVLMVLTVLSLFALSGRKDNLSVRGLWLGFTGFCKGVFVSIPAPFRSLGHASGRKIGLGLLGLLIGLPVVVLMTLLLASADTMFALWLSKLDVQLLDSEPLGKLVWTLVLGLMLFSFLFTLAQPREEPSAPATELRIPSILFRATLLALAVIYAAFAYIQFRYLFSGAQSVPGGYAEYARRGFFQLTAVSALTLGIVLTVLSLAPSKLSNGLCAVVSALTVVIAASAAWRMVLYIQCYGLTLLRVLTLWGIAMIAAALILSIVRCFRPFQLGRSILALWLAAWVALNLVNLDGVIARWNVSAYVDGRLESLDAAYLCTFSPDVLPVLNEYASDDHVALIAQTLKEDLERIRPESWYEWKLSWRHMEP